MRKEYATSLKRKAQDVAAWFSRPDRPKNTTRETFTVQARRLVYAKHIAWHDALLEEGE